MPWNPDTYNQFKNERNAPFFDLLNLVASRPALRVIDLGCGTGELSSLLADKLPGSEVLGIDSSAEMLAQSRMYEREGLHFEQKNIEEIIGRKATYDLIFSNAAIQWMDDHEKLFPELIELLTTGGQIAIQIPSNYEHYSHRAIRKIARESPFIEALNGWIKTPSVLSIEAYAHIFYDCGLNDIVVFEKVYPHILADAEAIVKWTTGTALVPYLEKLSDDLKNAFIERYKRMLMKEFPETPVFYPFKRILMSGSK